MALVLRRSALVRICGRASISKPLTMRVTRKVVNGRVSRVQTEYSEDDLPLDPDFATELLRWKGQCPASPEDWVFPNPDTLTPYYASEIQKDFLVPAGKAVELKVKGEVVSLGWHVFRHTYRSLLDATEAPVGVQQKLMRLRRSRPPWTSTATR